MPAFLDGGGECGALIKSRDWSDSLGPVEGWPLSLKSATGLMLRSAVPMALLWGERGILLYNDGYMAIAGGNHPRILGMPVEQAWPEAAEFNRGVLAAGLAGRTVSLRDQQFHLERGDQTGLASFDLDYSPVPGEDGRPAGVLAIVIETTRQIAAERSLRESEVRLRSVLDGMGEAFLLVDRDLRIIHANPLATAIDGRSNEELTGRTIVELWPEAENYPTIPAYRRALAEGVPVDLVYRHLSDEHDVWLEVRAYPIEDDLAIFYRDVTQRERQKAALEESEGRFRNIADHTSVMLWVTDETGYCTYLNRPWYEFTGQAPGRGEGFGWLEAVHPDDRPEAERKFIRANEEQRAFETDMRVRRADGSYRWCIDSAAPRFTSTGEFLGFVGSVLDVDDRKEAIDRVHRSEEQFRALIEQMPIGVAVARVPSGEIFLYNQAIEKMLGHPILSEDKATYDRYGGVDADGSPVPLEAYPLYRAVAFGETVVGDEMRYRRPDGRIITLLGHAAPITGDDGTPDMAVVALEDISSRKQAEAHQQLLINELSHRAKNLLAIIQSLAQQSFKGDGNAGQLARFEGRLGALSTAHGILTQERWEAVPLRRLICDTFTAVRPDDDRLLLDGPDLMLPPKVAVSLAMAIHELATNALKYGSLGNETGTVAIRWSNEGGRLKLDWKEHGGPPVTEPDRRGFGSRMIERGLAAELGGRVTIRFETDGVRCEVDAPMPAHG